MADAIGLDAGDAGIGGDLARARRVAAASFAGTSGSATSTTGPAAAWGTPAGMTSR